MFFVLCVCVLVCGCLGVRVVTVMCVCLPCVRFRGVSECVSVFAFVRSCAWDILGVWMRV